MNRRRFLANQFGAGSSEGSPPATKLVRDAAFVANANAAEAAFLLRRTLFGHGKAELERPAQGRREIGREGLDTPI